MLFLRRAHSPFIKNIYKNKDKQNNNNGVNMISKQRPQIIEEVDKLLLVFINEKKFKLDSMSKAFICEKALDIYGDLVKKILGANSKDFDFKASRG